MTLGGFLSVSSPLIIKALQGHCCKILKTNIFSLRKVYQQLPGPVGFDVPTFLGGMEEGDGGGVLAKQAHWRDRRPSWGALAPPTA